MSSTTSPCMSVDPRSLDPSRFLIKNLSYTKTEKSTYDDADSSTEICLWLMHCWCAKAQSVPESYPASIMGLMEPHSVSMRPAVRAARGVE
jgi:hypothetical protein